MQAESSKKKADEVFINDGSEESRADRRQANAGIREANNDIRQANNDIRQSDTDIRQANADIRQANADTESKCSRSLQRRRRTRCSSMTLPRSRVLT